LKSTGLPLENEKGKPRVVIRSELNIERWAPLFVTSKYKGRSREFFRTLEDGRTVGVVVGKQLDHKGNVIEVGVLTVPGLKVFYSLIKIWEQAGRPADRVVYSTLPDLARQMGRGWGGKDYRDLRRILRNLHTIPISWIGSFYQKERGVFITIDKGFHVLDNLEFYDEVKGDKLLISAFSYKFNQFILDNLLNHYTKPLDLDVILGLRKELSVLLYCHIDLVMADKERYERRTKELFENLGVEGGKYRYPSARKQNLEPSLKELVGARLSTGRLVQAYLQRPRDKKDWKAVFVKTPSHALSSEVKATTKALVFDILEVTGDEHSRGFYTKLARLAAENPVLEDIIYVCLSEVKDEWHRGKIRKSKGALFTDKIKRYCQEREIDLGLKSSS